MSYNKSTPLPSSNVAKYRAAESELHAIRPLHVHVGDLAYTLRRSIQGRDAHVDIVADYPQCLAEFSGNYMPHTAAVEESISSRLPSL